MSLLRRRLRTFGKSIFSQWVWQFLSQKEPSSGQSAVLGHLDTASALEARGWAYLKKSPEGRLSVEILDDNNIVARGTADLFRPDLLKAGFGDGNYGFAIPLSWVLEDGVEHQISARIADSGEELIGHHKVYVQESIIDGAVEGLEGECIAGWAINLRSPDRTVEVVIYESGIAIAQGLANQECSRGRCKFCIPIPAHHLDGSTHTFVVSRNRTKQIIDSITLMTPVFLSKGTLLSCLVARVIDGHVFGWIRLADDCDPSKLDLSVETNGGFSRVVNFGKELGESVAGGRAISFVASLGDSSVAIPKSFAFRDRSAGGHDDALFPVPLRPYSGWGRFDHIEGICCIGWVFTGEGQTTTVEVAVDGVLSAYSPETSQRTELLNWGLPIDYFGFRIQLPERALDGREHEISLRVTGNPESFEGSSRSFKYAPVFYIDVAGPARLAGWIFNPSSDDAPMLLDVRTVGGGARLVGSSNSVVVRDDVYKIHGRRYVGFDIPLNRPRMLLEDLPELQVFLKGTKIPALPITISMVEADRLIKTVEDIASTFNKMGIYSSSPHLGGQLSPEMGEVFRRAIFPRLISDIRGAIHGGKSVWSINNYKEKQSNHYTIDVIIPVYKGYEETIDCIRSILAAQCMVDYELIVINDNTPDTRLAAELRVIADKAGFTLLENEKNLGFVASVNRGMALHEAEGRNVVLLNADTVVPSGWLDGLHAAAYSGYNIGTVTPFSNRATICSLPRPRFDNDLVDDNDCQSMHDICARVNNGEVIDIPTAVGFCMYIRRKTLMEVGPFDEEKWKKGYGEENDFCVKARAIGWRNVAAPGVFVQHHGSVSFAEEKDERVRENLAVLNEIYPDYPTVIKRFIQDDPLSAARARVNLELLRQRASGYMLHIGHSWGGGTERAISDLAECLVADGISSLIMEPAINDAVVFSSADGQIPVSISLKNGLAELVDKLREIGVFHIHFHQMIGYSAELWNLPVRLGVPYDVSIHDYFFICPRVQLINDNGIFCGQPEVEVCESCCSTKPLSWEIENVIAGLGNTVAEWRKFHQARLTDARMVIAPSNDAGKRIQRYYKLDNIVTLPHPESGTIGKLRVPKGDEITVAVIGAIGPHKGAELLLHCAKYAKANRLPVSFVVIGYTNMDDKFRDLDNVIITGKFKSAGLPKLIDACGCTVALFLSIWPETYSYTLSEALEQGLTPVAFDLGAFEERISGAGRGVCMPFVPKAEIVVKALLSVKTGVDNSSHEGGKPVGTAYNSCASDYYGFTVWGS